jgi:hypothetical protein
MKIRELFEEEKGKSVGELEIFGKEVAPDGKPRDYWEGEFDCSARRISSLEGSPKQISGAFICSYNKDLTSLKGATQKGIDEFDCHKCDIISLEGCPEEIFGGFSCESNKKLTSLKGMPQKGLTYVNVYDCDLRSLEGCPEIINGHFNCSGNKNLTSLKGVPKKIKWNLSCQDTSISSLKDIHKMISQIDGIIDLPLTIKSNILGLLKIKNLKKVSFISNMISATTQKMFHKDLEDIADIINKYLPNPTPDKIIDCQNELVEAGFEEYAEL